MILHRVLLAVCATSMMTVASFAADAPPPADCPAHHAGMGLMRQLTPEQRIMLFAQNREATAGMNDEQRRDYRRTERDKLMAMSEADRQKFVAGLQAKWNALPEGKKAELRQQAEQFRGDHPMMGSMAGRDGC